MSIIVTHAKFEDLVQVSSIHMESFGGYFLHSFGEDFLRIYYSNYLLCEDHFLLVSKSQDGPIGFVAGTCNQEGFYQRLFREHFVQIAGIALKRTIVNKDFRKQVLKKKQFIINALKARIFPLKRKRPHEKTADLHIEEKRFRLLSIAVLEKFRGTGVSLSLIKAFETEALRRGGKKCLLSVKPDNLRGISFYKKADWQLLEHTEHGIIFCRNLS